MSLKYRHGEHQVGSRLLVVCSLASPRLVKLEIAFEGLAFA